MNQKLKQHINSIKLYLNLTFILHLIIQLFILNSFLLTILSIANIFIKTTFPTLFAVLLLSSLTLITINLKLYFKKTSKKYFIYKYLEKNFPSLSSSLSTLADKSLIDTSSKDFLKETEKQALREIQKINKKDIPPLFSFEVFKYPILITGFLWFIILFPMKTEFNNLIFGEKEKEIKPLVKTIELYNLKLIVTPPDYLKKEKKEIENFDGSFKVYTGSQIELTGITYENYDKCVFIYAGTKHDCTIKNKKFKITRKIQANSIYHIEFTKKNDKNKYISKSYEGEIIPDDAPEIKIVFPTESLTLNYNDTLQITAQASDDIALSKILFKYQIDNEDFETVEIPVSGFKKETVDYKLVLSEFEKGDTITYYFEAYDNDTVLGPKIASSRKLKVEIISEMKIHEDFLKELDKIVKGFVPLLADHLELNRKEPFRTVMLKKNKINDNILKINENLKKLISQNDPLLSESSLSILKSVNQKLQIAIEEDRNDIHSKKLIKTLEDTIIYITDILDREKIEIINQLYKSLKNSKTKLKKLINDYRLNHDKKTKKKILKEIRNIKRKIQRILEKLSQLSADIDSKYINKEASKVKKMAKNIENMEDLLEKGELDKLLKQLDELEKEINEMIEGTQDKKEGLMRERDEQEDKESQKFMNDLQDLIFEQQQLLNQTQKITSKLSEKLKKEIKDNNFIQKNLNLLQEANNYLFNLNKDLISNDTKENISRITEGINLAISFLKSKNILMALNSLYEISFESQRVDLSYKNSLKWSPRKYLEDLKEDYKLYLQADKNKEKVIKNIEKILNKLKNSITPEDLKKMQKLSQAQKNLINKMKQLQNQAQKLPISPPNTDEILKQGENFMQNAEELLKNNNPNMAKFKQNAALEKLNALKKNMQKQKQQINKNRMTQGQQNRGRKIKIPDDKYKGPRELREDILKAMKNKAPEGKKKTVEKYFKNIIKH